MPLRTTAPVVIATWVLTTVAAPSRVFAQDSAHAELLETYRNGDLRVAVRTVVLWPEERIRSAARSLEEAARPEHAMAAAMLHTEAAFELHPDRRASMHMNAAQRAIARLSRRPAADAFVARWHGLVALYHAMHQQLVLAQREVNQARARARDNPDVELLIATLLELPIPFAEPNIRGAWGTFDIGVLQNDLNKIVNAYRGVLERHPDFVEARLRFGWALYLARSSSERVREQLEGVVERATRSDLRYLAHLFLGALAERDHRLDDAMREYEAAHAAEAHQTSLVALIGMAGTRGSTVRVAELTRELLRLPTSGRRDPWLYYNSGFTGGGLLDGLRAEVRMP